MYKQILIAILIVFGLSVAGESAYACQMHTETHTTHQSSKHQQSPENSDNCCAMHHDDKQSTDDGCDHNCQQSCHCPSISVLETENGAQSLLAVQEEETVDFHYTSLNNSIEFHAIWQPPKIG